MTRSRSSVRWKSPLLEESGFTTLPEGTVAIDDRPDIANGLDELRPEIEREELDCSHYLRQCSHFGTEDVREKAMTK